MLINRNYKTSCGLIQDGLFTGWKFRFVFDPLPYDLQLVLMGFSTLHSSSLR